LGSNTSGNGDRTTLAAPAAAVVGFAFAAVAAEAPSSEQEGG
jgi:hypothetical protein